MVVVLDEQDRAVHPVVERGALVPGPDPGQVSLAEMPGHLRAPVRAGRLRQRVEVGVGEREQQFSLPGCQILPGQPRVGQDEVVPPGGGPVPSVHDPG